MTMGPRRGGSRTAPTSRWATDFGCEMEADEHSLGFFLAALPRRTDDTPSLPCRREPIPAPTPGFPLVGGNDGGPASAGMVAGSCHSERSEESKATACAYTSSLDSRSAPAPYSDAGAEMTMGPRRGGSRTAPTSRWATDSAEHSLGFFLAALPRRTDDTPSLPCRREPIPAPTPGFPLVGGNDGGPASAGMVAGSCHSERSEESKATAIAYTAPWIPDSDAGEGMTMRPRRGGSRTAPASRWATDSGCAMEADEYRLGYSVAPVQTGAHPRPHAWIPARGRE